MSEIKSKKLKKWIITVAAVSRVSVHAKMDGTDVAHITL